MRKTKILYALKNMILNYDIKKALQTGGLLK